MDRLDAMRLFIRIVERRSFTLAAQDMGVPRSTATQVMRQMEQRLGVLLLQRTTRRVSPTLDGEAFARRCAAVLADVEDAESAFSGAKPKGVLRVDVHGTLARHFLWPDMPAFLERYPDIELVMGESDRLVDLVREGVDCVLRVGSLPDSDMVARRVAMLEEITCASADYLERTGLPEHPDALEGHCMIGFRSSRTGSLIPLEFQVDGELRDVVLPASVSVAAGETMVVAARLGLGLIQVPRYHLEADLAAGTLVEVLSDFPPTPTPVSLLYPQSRQLSPRLRVFMDWVVRRFRASEGVAGRRSTPGARSVA